MASAKQAASSQAKQLYGLADGGALVLVDRFARTNFNAVTLAYSGAGKSYKAKLEALRLLYRGVQVFILDPRTSTTRSARRSAARTCR
jgi:hypothetical protein